MNNKIVTIIMAALILVSASGCSVLSGESSKVTPAMSNSASIMRNDSRELVLEDLASARATENSGSTTQITLNGSDAAITGGGAKLSGSTLTITQGGTYTLTGRFTGSIVITTPATDKVQLILDGVNITADRNAAIYCTQAGLLTITLADGSINAVTDGVNFTYADATAEEPDAAIFSKPI